MAGFAAFVLAPALQMPPELPGAAAIDVTIRQAAWLGIAVATIAVVVLGAIVSQSLSFHRSFVGATVVARHAGDLISEIHVAMAAGMGLGRLWSVIHPYPTQAEAIPQIGAQYNRSRLTPTVARLLATLIKLRR